MDKSQKQIDENLGDDSKMESNKKEDALKRAKRFSWELGDIVFESDKKKKEK